MEYLTLDQRKKSLKIRVESLQIDGDVNGQPYPPPAPSYSGSSGFLAKSIGDPVFRQITRPDLSNVLNGDPGVLKSTGSSLFISHLIPGEIDPQSAVGTLQSDGSVVSIGPIDISSLPLIDNAHLSNMPASTFKANVTGVSATPQDISPSQAKTLLAINAGDVSGLGLLATQNVVSLTSQATGTLQAAQFPGISGDVSVASGSFTSTISALPNSKLAQMPTLTIKGNNTGVASVPLDLTATQTKSLLAIGAADVSGLGALATQNTVSLTSQATGTLQAFQFPSVSGDVVIPSGSLVSSISSLPNSKLAQMPALTIKGNNTGATSTPLDLTAAQVKTELAIGFSDISGLSLAAQEPAHTGDVTNPSGSLAMTISPSAVSNSKLANMPALTIKCNITGVSAVASDNSISSTLDATISPNPGAIPMRSAGAWSGLQPGTSGQIISSQGAGLPLQYVTPSIPFNALTAANASNFIDNSNFAQTWNWTGATTQTPLSLNATALTTAPLLSLVPSTNSVAISSFGRLNTNVGATTNTTPIQTLGSINDFMETKIKNSSVAAGAQSGFTAESDTGTATSGFAWMGINGSAFNNPQTYNAGVAGDVTYVGSGQDMIIANASQTKDILFQTGKAATPFFDTRLTVKNSGRIDVGVAAGLFSAVTGGTLCVNGNIATSSLTIASANWTVTTESNLILSTGDTITQNITLPVASAATLGRTITIVNIDSIQKTITSFNGLTNALTTGLMGNMSGVFYCNGGGWQLISLSSGMLSSFSTYMTAAQSIPTGVNTAILLDTKRYDRRIDCSTVTGFFTCRTTGIHQFSANCRLNLGAVTLTGEAYIEIFNNTNGLSYRAGFSQGTSASPNLFYYAHISTNMSLTKGDVIQLRVRQNSGSATVISNVESNTFFMGSTLQ